MTELETALAVESMQGKLVQNLISRFLGIDIEKIKAGDREAILAAAKKIAELTGLQAEADEIEDVYLEIVEHDIYGALYELGDAMMKYCGPKASPPKSIPPAPSIRMMGAAVKTHAQAKEWLALNRQQAIRGSETPGLRLLFKRHPEVKRIVAGEMGAAEVAGLSDEQKAKIIDAMRTIARVATLVGTFYPPALILATVLNLIIAYYDAHHPTTGTGDDVGLSFEDMAS